MMRHPQAVPSAQSPNSPRIPMVLLQPCSGDACVVYINGPLRVPMTHELRHRVRALLRQGERRVVLDLARVPRIDAAGVGELVRAYNMANAAHGVLSIAHASTRVRQVLEHVGLFTMFSSGDRSALRSRAGDA